MQNLTLLCPGNNKRGGQKVNGYDLKVKQFYGALAIFP